MSDFGEFLVEVGVALVASVVIGFGTVIGEELAGRLVPWPQEKPKKKPQPKKKRRKKKAAK